jgi:asparagine synthase (glutamine-hydrolysing)
MCGIAGWIDWEQDLTSQGQMLERMVEMLYHRGPDAHGHWLSTRAALAHSRLIVIDPHGGTQPMIYQAGEHTYALTYNGELYNFRELRSELESCGHAFRTQSDTEVLLHTYVEWGEDCVHHLNGIFAFGLWDEQKQQLLLVRDHLGVKPLFYAQRGSAVLFGSELKALLAHPSVKAEIDITGLTEIFSFRRTPGSGVFRNVYELRPGHILTSTRHRTQITRYWNLCSEAHTDDPHTTSEHIRALLEDTVRRQLIADVPVVTMLSGGLDSSSLSALAAREFKREGKQLHTYSVDFVDSAQHFQGDVFRPSLDAPWVKRVGEHIGSKQHTIMVDTPELVENLLVPVHAHDLPTTGEIETSLYLLCKAMKEHATVGISGESADEVFGGYPWFYNKVAINAPIFPWFVMMGATNNKAAFFWISAEVMQKIKPAGYAARLYQESLAEVPRLRGEAPKAARMREIFYLALTHFLPMLLDRKDRMSMAVGFEMRVPFCDYRLVEYAWNIPWHMKNVGNIEKGILRHALVGILPDDARNRRKSAYPTSQNPAYLEALRKWILNILNNPNSPILPFINADLLLRVAKGKVPLPGDIAAFHYEHVIQTNAWLKDYHVSVC